MNIQKSSLISSQILVLGFIFYFLFKNTGDIVGITFLVSMFVVTFFFYKWPRFQLTLLVLLFVHIVGLFGLYYTSWFDSVSHFLWGFFLSYAAMSYLRDEKKIPMKFKIFFSIFFAISMGVFWEFFEFSWDFLFHQTPNYIISQPSLEDTMFDLFLDSLGAVIATISWRIFSK